MIRIIESLNIVDRQQISIQTLSSFIPCSRSFKTAQGKSTNQQTQEISNKSLNKSSKLKKTKIKTIEQFKKNNKNNLLITNPLQLQKEKQKQLQFIIPSRKRKQIKQTGFRLKQIFNNQRIKNLVKDFTSKLKINNTHSNPVQFTLFNEEVQVKSFQKQGFQFHDYVYVSISTFSMFQIVILFFLYTLSIALDQFRQNKLLFFIQCLSLSFYSIEMGLNFITVKYQQGKKLKKYRQIWRYYIRNNFLIDFLNVSILILDIMFRFQVTNLLRMIIVFKFCQTFQKIEKLIHLFFNTFYKQQYWSLIKLFIMNYCIAHFLAIILLAMTQIDSQKNWLIERNLINAPWYQKYVWSYYWSTTIMLTVGFGDITATTYKQAIILIFIQTISCMTLAYNINCIGSLLSNIKSQYQQKNKNLKIFRKLARKNNVTQNLEWKITTFIQETQNIKKKFNYEDQKSFIEKLPKGLKIQFLKESNINIFQKLPFFIHLCQKTLFLFAEKIQINICYPQKTLQQIDQKHNLMILKSGKIGFYAKKNNSLINNLVIDTIKSNEQQKPILLSLGFIKQNRMIYQIKSLQYSLIYFLEYENLLSILKETKMDYQWFCFLRDRCSKNHDQNELLICQLCKNRHTKFTCPKIHYIPKHQNIINKYLFKYRKQKCNRKNKYQRIKKKTQNCLTLFEGLNFSSNSSIPIKNSQIKEVKLEFDILQGKNYQTVNEKIISSQIEYHNKYLNKNTVDVIKLQMTKVLSKNECYDQIWIIQLDKIKNFKYYFQKENSYHLAHKFQGQKNKQEQKVQMTQKLVDFKQKNQFLKQVFPNEKSQNQTQRNRIFY